eukprot:SAG31_NODE_4252_length_3417_cov_1.831826_2_plen_105_part_00
MAVPTALAALSSTAMMALLTAYRDRKEMRQEIGLANSVKKVALPRHGARILRSCLPLLAQQQWPGRLKVSQHAVFRLASTVQLVRMFAAPAQICSKIDGVKGVV